MEDFLFRVFFVLCLVLLAIGAMLVTIGLTVAMLEFGGVVATVILIVGWIILIAHFAWPRNRRPKA